MATKEAPKTPEASAQFDHPNKRVFILVPADSRERDIVTKYLEAEVFPRFEKLPSVTHDLNVSRFRGNEVVYVVHPIDARIKGEDGKFAPGTKVHVSAPVDVGAFTIEDGEGFTSVSTERLFGAIAGCTKPCRDGRVYVTRISEDSIVQIHTC